jgi:transposase
MRDYPDRKSRRHDYDIGPVYRPISCPKCGGSRLRNKGWCRRKVRHDDWGLRRGMLDLQVRKRLCLDCGRSFRQRIPGIQPFQRASESFQEMVYQQHRDGINRSCLGRRKGIGAATVQRYFLRHLQRRARQDHAPVCPQILGIDEHFFTRKKGYTTTFCDLENHRIYDVTLGRSEAALESYFLSLEVKEQVRVVCMDLAVVYRSIVRKHFPKAVIVADRFHVIRLIHHHFLACWREIDPVGSKNRGLMSLMRRHRHNLKPDQELRLLAYLAQFLTLRRHAAFLVRGDRPHVAIHSLQRHHRRLSKQARWRPSAGRRTDSATSKTTGNECRCSVLNWSSWDRGCPRNWRRAVDSKLEPPAGLEPATC